MKHIHIIISGSVQGVFFRSTTKQAADRIGVKGFVKNLSDGTVETEVQGTEDQINQFLDYCKTGEGPANVENLKITEKEPTNEFTSFEIRYTT